MLCALLPAALLSVALSGSALAMGPEGPAEGPPAGFAGAHYVDSRGCGFVRVAREGHGAWAPRLSREGRPLCGLRPTFAAGAGPLDPMPVRIPRGYRRIWEDDRLNPMRGLRSERGDAMMALVWDDRVPARLVPPDRVPRGAAGSR